MNPLQRTDRCNEIVFGIDLPVSPEELASLRRSVGWPVEGDYERLLDENVFSVSARLDGRLVGFLQVVGSPHGDLLIHDVCVHPQVQRRGVGTRLMEIALDACQRWNPRGVNVLFEEKNRPFFERFGFRIMLGGYMDSMTLLSRRPKGFPGDPSGGIK